MFNWLRNRKTQGLFIDFTSLNNLYNYLIEENSYVNILVSGINSDVEMIWYDIPGSFINNEEELEVLNRNQFTNFYELLNTVYARCNVDGEDPTISLQEDYQFRMVQFNFYTEPNAEDRKSLNKVKASFYLFFVSTLESAEINDVRLFFRRSLDYSIQNLLDAEYIPDINKPEEMHKPYFLMFEKVIAAFAEETKVEINPKLKAKYPNALVSRDITIQDAQSIVEMVNYTSQDKSQFPEMANRLYESLNEDWETLAERCDAFYDDDHFPLRFEIFEEDNIWNSDWKFDPEDADYFVQSLLGESWDFTYPEETYSDDLFPYINQALEKQNLELLNMNTLGDNYLFFVVEKENVQKILSLSTKLRLGIEQLPY